MMGEFPDIPINVVSQPVRATYASTVRRRVARTGRPDEKDRLLSRFA